MPVGVYKRTKMMMTGKYKRTKWHCKNISDSCKGKKMPKFTKEWRLNIGLAKVGMKHSKISKLKMSKSHKGKPSNAFGIKHSKESRLKNSLAHLGEKSSRYIDGRASLKIRALKRDDYICQICGLRDPEIMEVDHIKPSRKFPKLKHKIDNVQVLCPNCHRRKTNKEHEKYNKKMRQ